MRWWQIAVVVDVVPDGVPQLAELLGVPVDALREAIGGPWDDGYQMNEEHLGTLGTVFTGVPDPRTPSRPMAVIQVDTADEQLTIGYAVGFPLVSGQMRWSPADPRTVLPYDLDEIRECLLDTGHPLTAFGTSDPQEALLAALQDALAKIANAATLSGTTW